MTNCESREALCVIKEKEVVWKYKGKRSEGGRQGRCQRKSVSPERRDWSRGSCGRPEGSGEPTEGSQQRAPAGWADQDGKVKRKGWSRGVPGKGCCHGSLDKRPGQTEGNGKEMEVT